ncbi:Ankyrin-2 [Neopestalotiopsis sp. 37M]|nr:Ankyrin-2 [Neopestalotiopsis sp. 37M]
MTTPADVSTASSFGWEIVPDSSDQIAVSTVHGDPNTSATDDHDPTNEVDHLDSHADSFEAGRGSPVQEPVENVAASLAAFDNDAMSLYQAIQNHDLKSVYHLLSQGVDLESVNEHGEKPLLYACKVGFAQAVWPLLDAGADVDSVNQGVQAPSTALHFTVGNHWLQATELLLLHGANVNAFSHNGMTALIIAIRSRKLQMIRLLLRYGANKKLGTERGDLPITFAQDDPEIIALLEMSQGPPTMNVKLQETSSALMTSVRPPTDSRDKMIACHNFQASVVEFHLGEFEERITEGMSVYQLLYGPKPIAKTTKQNMEWISPTGQSKGFKQIVAFKAPYLHFEEQSKFAAGAKELRDILSTLRRLKPSVKNADNADRLLHRRNPGDPDRWRAATPEILQNHLLKGYLKPKTKNVLPPLQTRRTLDQYFYTHIDTTERDRDQVSNSAADLLRLFKLRAARPNGDDIQDYLDIQAEADLLVEIEDIHDELMILEKVLDDQKSIMREIGVTLMDSTSTSDDDELDSTSFPVGDHLIIEDHLQRVKSMLKSTEKTKNTLLSLLDLKQKQASIFQAMASVRYSEQQADQARQTAIQGRTLMLFTVVTILFLPLSFMSAFFAIEIDAFPVDQNGKLALDYVLKYMLGISAGLSVPFIFVAFNQDRFVGWISSIRSFTRLNRTVMIIFAVLVGLGVLLSIIWTSSLADGIKVAVTITVVLGGFVSLAAIGIWRLVSLAPISPDPETSSSIAGSSHTGPLED